MSDFTIDRLDFDALHDDAVANERYGECQSCDDGEERLLCFCGVCFKYCHDPYFHEMFFDSEDFYPPEAFAEYEDGEGN